jgi:hypothetical protein
MQSLPNGEEDWDCWKRVAQLGPFSYESFPYVFYDCLHGGSKYYLHHRKTYPERVSDKQKTCMAFYPLIKNYLRQQIPPIVVELRRRYLTNHPIKRFIRNLALKRYRCRHKTVFLTFADGIVFNSDRIVKQAESTSFFDTILAYSSATLGQDFQTKYASHLKQKRGYGYWCWKPYIIFQTLRTMHTGDLLVYADSGCTLSDYAKTALEDMILENRRSSIPLFVANDSNFDHTIAQWTKADLLEYFGVRYNAEVLNRRMWEAGRLGIFAHPNTLELLEKWCEVAEQMSLIDDSPSTLSESPAFREHRHDQSIFNLLLNLCPFSSGIENALYATRLRN